jgi:Spy/CpxP family protein refolding chaperone
MAEIVNLRIARKARDRARAEQHAAENRAKFGRTKAQKQRDKAEAERLRREVEGARLESED